MLKIICVVMFIATSFAALANEYRIQASKNGSYTIVMVSTSDTGISIEPGLEFVTSDQLDQIINKGGVTQIRYGRKNVTWQDPLHIQYEVVVEDVRRVGNSITGVPNEALAETMEEFNILFLAVLVYILLVVYVAIRRRHTGAQMFLMVVAGVVAFIAAIFAGVGPVIVFSSLAIMAIVTMVYAEGYDSKHPKAVPGVGIVTMLVLAASSLF